ncbi:MAG: glycosyltransferase family 4 protein [bacterium]
MKIAVVAVASKTGEKGGAERFYEGLAHALRTAGADADIISIISDESSFDAIKESYLNFYELDLFKYDGVISTKAPSYIISHPNHICYLVHTMRVFYDMFDKEFQHPDKSLLEQRKFIQILDAKALSPVRTKKIFSIGSEVKNRLKKFNALESEVMHPALLNDNFTAGNCGDYLFIPGRLHRWKRIDLLIEAVKLTKSPVKLKIAGTGEDEIYFKKLAGGNKKIEFLGRVGDAELIALYANALAVPFVPLNEDYGYVTLEAFRSKKPVITCKDSGEPAYFVHSGKNGFVCKPFPAELAEKMDFFYNNPETAADMGERGYADTADIKWENIAQKLISALNI